MAQENAAAQETPEEIDARLAEEALLSGEDFEPSEDEPNGPAAQQVKKPDDSAADDIDPSVLAAIAGEDKPKMVPHARFNEVNEEAKTHRARVLELEEQVARLKGSAPAEPKKEEAKAAAYDFDEAEERYASALLDGEGAKAKEIRREIRAKEQEASDKRAEELADRRYRTNKAADDAKHTKLEFELEVSRAYSAFPFLDNSSAEANPEAIEEVLVWHQSELAKGKSPADAMKAAVAKIGPRYKKEDAGVTEKVQEQPKPDLAKAIARAEKVPAKAEGVGARAQSLNVARMTNKDIKALSPEDEARLAGDLVG